MEEVSACCHTEVEVGLSHVRVQYNVYIERDITTVPSNESSMMQQGLSCHTCCSSCTDVTLALSTSAVWRWLLYVRTWHDLIFREDTCGLEHSKHPPPWPRCHLFAMSSTLMSVTPVTDTQNAPSVLYCRPLPSPSGTSSLILCFSHQLPLSFLSVVGDRSFLILLKKQSRCSHYGSSSLTQLFPPNRSSSH